MEKDVRQDLYKAADEWMTAIGKKRKFLGGERPNLADIVSILLKKHVFGSWLLPLNLQVLFPSFYVDTSYVHNSVL